MDLQCRNRIPTSYCYYIQYILLAVQSPDDPNSLICGYFRILMQYTVPDTSYLRGSTVFRRFPAHFSMKVGEDICSTTTPLLRTTHANTAEGFVTGLCTYVCMYYTILGIKYTGILDCIDSR